jgi:hypothetical protein
MNKHVRMYIYLNEEFMPFQIAKPRDPTAIAAAL